MIEAPVAPTPARLDRAFAAFAWIVLGYNILVVLWGAYVRATGSGAGCGSHWPLCNGAVMPRTPTLATVIEYTHRLSSTLAGVLVIALLVWAFTRFPRGHVVRLGAVLSFVFIITEGMLGAGLVLFEHVAKNASLARAWSLSLHLTNTLTLIACLTLTAWWATGGSRLRLAGPALRGVAVSLLVTVLMGISGALAALGDTLFPATSLAEGFRQDFAPAAHIFLRLRTLHPFIAVAGGLCLLFYSTSAALSDRESAVRKFGWCVAVMVVVQLLAGVANLLLLAPVWMQIVHLLLGDVLWIGLVLLGAVLLAVPKTSQAVS